MDDPEKLILTTEQALSMLGEGDQVHTFRSTGFCLIGADWDRKTIEEAIAASKCELGGPQCQTMQHGLVVHCDGEPLFVECKRDFDYAAFERSILELNTSPR